MVNTSSSSTVTKKQTIVYVETLEQAEEACGALFLEMTLAMDTETYPSGLLSAPALIAAEKAFTDPYTNKVRLVQIKAEGAEEVYLFDMLRLAECLGLEPIEELLAAEHITWLGWNLKFDYKMLKVNHDVRLAQVYDLQLASDIMGYATGDQAYLARGRGLKDALRDYIGIKMSKKERLSNWGAPELTAEQIKYAADDVENLFELYNLFKYALEHEYKMAGAMDLENRVLPYVATMELNGFHFDPVMFAKVQRAAKAKIPKIEQQLCQWMGWPMVSVPPIEALKTGRWHKPMPRNYKTDGSPLDSRDYMLKAFRSKGIPCEDTKKETLKDLSDRFPMLKVFLSYRDLSKQLSNNYASWVNPQTGRIHPNYDQSGTTTGRFSSSNPNIQQVSKYELIDLDDGVSKINYRLCFRGPLGWKVAALDYSGQEISVMVALSGDLNLIKILNQPAYIERDGKMVKNAEADIHAMTAELIYFKSHGITCWTAKDTPYPGIPGKTFRDIVKAIVFGLAYGKTESGLAADFGITEDEARKIIQSFFKPYPTLKQKLDEWGKAAAKTSVAVFGLPEKNLWRMRMVRSSRHSDKGAAERAGKNVPIQGTSALMMKLAICLAGEALFKLGLACMLAGTVHDELIAFFPPEEQEIASEALGKAMDEASRFFLQGIVPDKHGKGISDTWTKD